MAEGAKKVVEFIQFIDARSSGSAVLDALRQRSIADFPAHIEQDVREIVEAVRARGDEALLEYERRFDCPTLTKEQLQVQPDEIEAAHGEVSPQLLGALRRARENVYEFHSRAIPHSWLESFDGLLMGQRITPLESVAVYVPAKHAPLPSTLYMGVMPARVAGVERVVVAVPPRKDGSIDPLMLVAADECGVDEVYRMGGAQAIAALAYGTDSVARVDKIVGPGSPWVIMAKRLVFGVVGIESLPGPSEAVIIADDSADPRVAAADLLSQAEHTGDNMVVLLTDSEELAKGVISAARRQVEELSRADLIRDSLADYSIIAVVASLAEAAQISNEIAPEHLQIMTAEPLALLEEIQHAGCICLGPLATVPLGDYGAGPSHILPTNGTARFSSPLNVEDFVKRSSIIYATQRGFERLAGDVETLAQGEGLDAHAQAITIRRKSRY